MISTGHSLVTVPPLRAIELNQNSLQYPGLVAAWLYAASGYRASIRDWKGANDAVPSGTFAWQETDNELGSGVYTAGDATGHTDCGNATALQVTANGLTLCVWVRLYQSLGTSGFPGLIGKGDSDSSTLGSYLLYLAGSPAKLNYLQWSGSTRVNALTGATSLDFQTTYHFAATWKPSTRVSIFVNGKRDATTTSSVAATLDNPSYNFLIGANQGGVNLNKYEFRGLMHEARLYNRALTEDEIWRLWAPQTRWDLYRAPQRVGLGKASVVVSGRVQGPPLQVLG